ncbi:MAG: recombinase family protein, partial [Rickettsiales bacterium]|nr:recombinase family protein [Rickettsiales bacterium]
VNDLLSKQVGIISLNDPIDTTTPQGNFAFNIFASLAEFERDLIIMRTQAGLTAARARGRKGGRPKGLSQSAKEKAYAAETLYKEEKLSTRQIAKQLNISKTTLYSYLKHRNVNLTKEVKGNQIQIPLTVK